MPCAATKECRAQHGSRRCVGDTHLADGKQITLGGNGSIPNIDGGEKLVRVHGRADGEVAGRADKFDRDHAQIGARQAGDLIDSGTASREIRNHLLCDSLRIGRDPARRHSMVSGKHRDSDAFELWNFAALPARQPYRQFFEQPKTARRLRQDLLTQGGVLGGADVAPRQVATEGADVV